MSFTMKIEIYTCLVFITTLLLSPCAGLAQNQGNVSATNIVAAMVSSLKLTIEQVREVTPVVTEWVKEAQVIKTKAISLDEQKRQLVSLQEDMESQLGHYLSEQQLIQWHNLITQTPYQKEKQRDEQPDKMKIPSSDKKVSSDDRNLSTQDDGVLQSGPATSNKGGVY